MKLFKHKNNTDVAVEVLSFFRPKGKDYARIKIRWWKVGINNWCMNYTERLTTAESYGKNKKERTKYPISKWENDWEEIQI